MTFNISSSFNEDKQEAISKVENKWFLTKEKKGDSYVFIVNDDKTLTSVRIDNMINFNSTTKYFSNYFEISETDYSLFLMKQDYFDENTVFHLKMKNQMKNENKINKIIFESKKENFKWGEENKFPEKTDIVLLELNDIIFNAYKEVFDKDHMIFFQDGEDSISF